MTILPAPRSSSRSTTPGAVPQAPAPAPASSAKIPVWLFRLCARWSLKTTDNVVFLQPLEPGRVLIRHRGLTHIAQGPTGDLAAWTMPDGTPLSSLLEVRTCCAFDIEALLVATGWSMTALPNLSDLGAILRLRNLPCQPQRALEALRLVVHTEATELREILNDEAPPTGIMDKSRAELLLLIADAISGIVGVGMRDDAAGFRAHLAINRLGLPIDVALARAADGMLALLGDSVLAHLHRYGLTEQDVRSEPHMKDLLAKAGFPVEDLKAETLDALLDRLDPENPEHDRVRALVAAKLMRNQGGSFGHFKALLGAVNPDGRLCGGYRFAGHRLGRFTSLKGRLHSMRKFRLKKKYKVKKNDADLETDKDRERKMLATILMTVAKGDYAGLLKLIPDPVDAALAVAGLVRLCLAAPERYTWAVADISSFEPMALLWQSGAHEDMKELGAGRSGYVKILAACLDQEIPMIGPDADDWYALAKVAFLAPMFGSKAKSVEDYAAGLGLTLSRFGVTGDRIVSGFRRRFPDIVKFWTTLHNAALCGIDGKGSTDAGSIRFSREGVDLVLHLPSGRCIHYPDARIERGRRSETIHYTRHGSKTTFEDMLWDGRLCQNTVSSMCRDLFISALDRIMEDPPAAVLHTHDEIGILVPLPAAETRLAQLIADLTAPVPWAPGLVLRAKGYMTTRYHKEPFTG